MPYTIESEPGEEVLLRVRFSPSPNSPPFNFAVSNRALYLPATKLVVHGDPTCFRRVPKAEVTEIGIQPLKPYALWVFSALMVAAGAVSGFWMMMPFFSGMQGTFQVSGYPLAVLVGGLLLPLAARGRRRLLVRMGRKSYAWTPPLVLDRESKDRIQAVMTQVTDACREAGMPVPHEAV